jgi:thioredoxin reductase (NADPH)
MLTPRIALERSEPQVHSRGQKECSVAAEDVREVVVIGSGPAGYTAAIYAARAQLEPLVFEGSQYGGELMTTTEVENYPGFSEGIMGPALMEEMRTQARRFGAELVSADVTAVDLEGDIKTVTVDGVDYRTRSVVLAMGAKPRHLGVPGEDRLIGRGVSTCATCDGFFFREHDIAVVGGGDSAMEEALFLSRFGRSVTIIHRRDEFRASKIMFERAKADPKIHWMLNAVVTEILGEDTVSGVKVRDTQTGAETVVPVTGVFVAIGHNPRSELVRDQLPTDPDGYVLVDPPGTTRTKLPGVYASGDLVDRTYRQAVTAAGTGCQAAIDAERWLAHQPLPAEVSAH